MAGHSHSANIAARKGAVDKKRSKAFTKLSRAIMSAVRQGGVDPDANLKLKYAIEKARAANVPKDNIERVIKRAAGEKGADQMEEVLYEGYASGGIALMVACLTDNRHRTAPDIKHLFDKHGGNLGSPGSVGFLFQQRSIYVAGRGERSEDAWMEIGLDLGLLDVRVEGEWVTLLAASTEFLTLKQALEKAGIALESAEIGYVPLTLVKIEDKELAKQLLKLLDALEDNEDVQNVYANYDMPPEWLAELVS